MVDMLYLLRPVQSVWGDSVMPFLFLSTSECFLDNNRKLENIRLFGVLMLDFYYMI